MIKIISEGLQRKPCLFLSGGVDSLVTLHLVRKQGDVPVIVFMQDFSKEQREKFENLFGEWDLTVYTYPPRHRYFVPNGEGLSLIDEYGFGRQILPIIRDIEQGTNCGLKLDESHFEGFYLGWDTVFTGILKEDSHPVTGPLVKSAVREYEGVRFISPLFDWTKQKVLEYAKENDLLKFVVEGTGELKACVACLTATKKVYCPAVNGEIPAVSWDKKKMLENFQKRFGFEV